MLPGAPEISPDLAGWRKTRLAALPDTPIDVVPDWVCEVLLPSTRRTDLVIKRAFYARVGVPFCWYVDLDARAVTVSRLENGRWVELGVFGPDALLRAEPFEDIDVDVKTWWAAADTGA